jgi:hypothetical protein
MEIVNAIKKNKFKLGSWSWSSFQESKKHVTNEMKLNLQFIKIQMFVRMP